MKLMELDKKNVLILNPDVLNIPEFRVIWDRDKLKTKDRAYKELAFIFYTTAYNSPYYNHDLERRVAMVKKDFLRDEHWEADEDTLKAVEKYKELQYSPTQDLLDAVESQFRKSSAFLRDTDLDPLTVRPIMEILKNIAPMVANQSLLQAKLASDETKNNKLLGNKSKAMFEDAD